MAAGCRCQGGGLRLHCCNLSGSCAGGRLEEEPVWRVRLSGRGGREPLARAAMSSLCNKTRVICSELLAWQGDKEQLCPPTDIWGPVFTVMLFSAKINQLINQLCEQRCQHWIMGRCLGFTRPDVSKRKYRGCWRPVDTFSVNIEGVVTSNVTHYCSVRVMSIDRSVIFSIIGNGYTTPLKCVYQKVW